MVHNSVMAADSIHTVFISSTYEDLREERAEVQKAVLQLGCLPIGMELFPSADSSAWGYIRSQIERSDYYILIVGNRYGSVDLDGVSFTEKEYRLARELNKPCVVFLRSDSMEVSQDKNEKDVRKKKKLERFVKELNQTVLAQRFESQHQLNGKALHGLIELRRSNPTAGYVRADELRSLIVAEHSEEIQELKLKVEDQTDELEDAAREYHDQKRDFDEELRAVQSKLRDLESAYRALSEENGRLNEALSQMDKPAGVIPSATKVGSSSFEALRAVVEQSGNALPTVCPDCGGNGKLVSRIRNSKFEILCERCDGQGAL